MIDASDDSSTIYLLQLQSYYQSWYYCFVTSTTVSSVILVNYYLKPRLTSVVRYVEWPAAPARNIYLGNNNELSCTHDSTYYLLVSCPKEVSATPVAVQL